MNSEVNWPDNKTELYELLEKQLSSLVEDCPPVSALANAAALLWEALSDINWAGFYLLKGKTLHLGPFHGKPACTIIPVGRGVCGTAAATRQIQLVHNVHEFPGHIACDSASNSEIVIPIIRNNLLLGVMDIDSPIFTRFDATDANGLSRLCSVLSDEVEWSDGLL